MSVLVGVCSKTSCTLFADHRELHRNSDGGIDYSRDDVDKMFKVNENLLYGVTGFIPNWEKLTGPLEDREDLAGLNAEELCQIIVDYLNANENRLADAGGMRSYVVGGLNSQDQFCLYKVSVEPGHYQTIVEEINPVKDGHSIGMVYCTSPAMSKKLEVFDDGLRKVVGVTHGADNANDLIAKYIQSATREDPFVGGGVDYITVSGNRR